MKPGIAASPRTKLNGKRAIFSFVIITLVASIIACTRSVVQPWQLTATAISTQNSIPPAPTSAFTANPPAAVEIPDAIETDFITPMPSASPTLVSTESNLTVTPYPLPSPEKGTDPPPILYYTQAGDTLPLVAVRFNVSVNEIITPQIMPPVGSLLAPNLLLIIPNRLPAIGPGDHILPDSEIVFSPSAIDFDLDEYVKNAGGYLSTYKEWLSTGWNTGADVVRRVAIENSINPRLLLALIEFRGHWVFGQPRTLAETDYPLGYTDFSHKGLFMQLSWVVSQISIGYYGWREGLITNLDFPDDKPDSTMRLSPQLNAGSVALQFLFSKLLKNKQEWSAALYSKDSAAATHEKMFGNPWLRAQTVEPLYPTNLQQPPLQLPFVPGRVWSFSGGPHSAWGPDGALAAVDFAPSAMSSGCVESNEWVTSAAPGKVVRTGVGVVVIDLDGDGYEQTGWALFYMHIKTPDRILEGTIVNTGDRIGHPSCEGGVATGTHFHLARKYNGEWILADGPIPMVLSGWQAHAGKDPYTGSFTMGDQIVTACACGSFETHISLPLSIP